MMRVIIYYCTNGAVFSYPFLFKINQCVFVMSQAMHKVSNMQNIL